MSCEASGPLHTHRLDKREREREREREVCFSLSTTSLSRDNNSSSNMVTNPYMKKPRTDMSPAGTTVGAEPMKGENDSVKRPEATATTSSTSAPPSSSSACGSNQVAAVLSTTTTAAAAAPVAPPLSRKAQLRKEIEDLKRRKKEQQWRMENEKRKKNLEKEERKRRRTNANTTDTNHPPSAAGLPASAPTALQHTSSTSTPHHTTATTSSLHSAHPPPARVTDPRATTTRTPFLPCHPPPFVSSDPHHHHYYYLNNLMMNSFLFQQQLPSSLNNNNNPVKETVDSSSVDATDVTKHAATTTIHASTPGKENDGNKDCPASCKKEETVPPTTASTTGQAMQHPATTPSLPFAATARTTPYNNNSNNPYSYFPTSMMMMYPQQYNLYNSSYYWNTVFSPFLHTNTPQHSFTQLPNQRPIISHNNGSSSKNDTTNVPATLQSSTTTAATETLSVDQVIDRFFIVAYHKAHMDPTRLVGCAPNENNIQSFMPSVGSSPYSTALLWQKWNEESAEMERNLRAQARQHWNEQWELLQSMFPVACQRRMTDSECYDLRMLPRPWKGCRCKSPDHQYVNHPDCPLYLLERAIRGNDENDPPIASNAVRQRLELPSDKKLNPTQAAFKERFIRLKEELSNEEAEAEFVGRMENIQLNSRSKALLAPSLNTMVLSSLMELQSKFESIRNELMAGKETAKISEDAVSKANEDDEDDEDMPLGQLEQKVIQEVTVCVHYRCLKEILVFIGKRWGHAYREPSNEEFSWRWETFHNRYLGTRRAWDVQTKNHRVAGSKSLDNLELAFRDDLTESKGRRLVTYLSSSARTGLMDEIFALLKAKTISVDTLGVPSLSRDWYSKVEHGVLLEMDREWGVAADSLGAGRYLIPGVVKKTLRRKWRHIGGNWALSKDISTVIYSDTEYERELREFNEKRRKIIDESIGIQRFGFESTATTIGVKY